jgi:hypothetical protein
VVYDTRVRRMAAVGCVVVLAAVLACGTRIAAHDIERTQVLLTFARDGSFVLDVANDPGWLKLRMEPFTGRGPEQAALQDAGAVFIDRVVLFVDGHEVRPTSAEFIDGETLATYRLRGKMPIDARSLRWYYGLVGDPYPLTIRRADGRMLVEEIAGNAWSGTIDLSGQFQAPRAIDRLAPLVIVGLLLIPLAIRLSTRLSKRNHEDAKTRTREKSVFR